MKYSEFEDAISPDRMHRYVSACTNDTKRAMTLYRYNIKLSQEMYAIISCFEVSLRNKINKEMRAISCCQEADLIRIPEWKVHGKSSRRRMKDWFDAIDIVLPNCWPRWSLEYGNLCLIMCNTGCRVDVC